MEQIYQEFIALVGKTDVSQQTLNSIVDSVYKDGMTDEEKTAAFEIGKKLVTTFQGNLNKGIADAVAKVKPKSAKTETTVEPTDPHENEVISKIQRELDEMKKKLLEQEKNLLVENKKTLVLNKLKELGIKDDDYCVEAVNLIHISEESDVDALAGKVVGLYNKFKAANAEDTPTPGQAAGGGVNPEKWASIFKSVAPKDEV